MLGSIGILSLLYSDAPDSVLLRLNYSNLAELQLGTLEVAWLLSKPFDLSCILLR
jgi:hypothetical protein